MNGSDRMMATVEVLEDRRLLSAASTAQERRDAIWLMKTNSAELQEIALGNLAQTHALNSQVKDLGTTLVTDHTAADQQLMTIATTAGVTLSGTMDKQDQAIVNRFSKLTGARFDQAFSAFEVQDHKKDIKDFQRENKVTTNADIQTFTSDQIPVLEQHLTLAESAESVVGMAGGDKAFMLQALSGNRLEIQLGDLAQTNGVDASVKSLGSTLSTDHTTALNSLTPIATSLGVTDPGKLDAGDQAKFNRLSKLTGAQFDKAYAKLMVQDHHADIAKYAAENKRTKNDQLKTYTTTQLPVLQTHLSLAQTTLAAVKNET